MGYAGGTSEDELTPSGGRRGPRPEAASVGGREANPPRRRETSGASGQSYLLTFLSFFLFKYNYKEIIPTSLFLFFASRLGAEPSQAGAAPARALGARGGERGGEGGPRPVRREGYWVFREARGAPALSCGAQSSREAEGRRWESRRQSSPVLASSPPLPSASPSALTSIPAVAPPGIGCLNREGTGDSSAYSLGVQLGLQGVSGPPSLYHLQLFLLVAYWGKGPGLPRGSLTRARTFKFLAVGREDSFHSSCIEGWGRENVRGGIHSSTLPKSVRWRWVWSKIVLRDSLQFGRSAIPQFFLLC